jgi:hypothetical protein
MKLTLNILYVLKHMKPQLDAFLGPRRAALAALGPCATLVARGGEPPGPPVRHFEWRKGHL